MSGPAGIDALPILREAQLRDLVSTAEAIATMQQAYWDFGTARNVLSRPESMGLSAAGTSFKLKGGISPSHGVVGFRLVAAAAGGLLSHCLVMEAATGRPIGLVDETWLHRLRTASTSAVAARLLARPDARRLAIVGAGRIAEEIPAAFRQLFDIEDIAVTSRTFSRAEDFATRHRARAIADIDAAIDGADIVVAITAATSPVLAARHLAPGVTLLGLGGGAEIGADVLAVADRFVVDDLEFASAMGSVAGWIAAGTGRDHIEARLSADIGEIAAGTKPGRIADSDRVLAVIQGMASCDVALAAFALGRALPGRQG